MSKQDQYFVVPLSMLRKGQNELQSLEYAISYGIVNAGIGYQQAKGEEAFERALDQAKEYAEKQGMPILPPPEFRLKTAEGENMSKEESNKVWFCAQVGAKILDVKGGNYADFARIWADHHHEGEVFFRIKRQWLWGAFCCARRANGEDVTSEVKPLSWREVRILAAILSAKTNHYDFSFLGWECIQARASGFHSKKLFNNGKKSLPKHCQPLTRQMIRVACNKLESLGFFARCRYSSGKSGGFTAYSFRHPRREDLQNAVIRWSSDNKLFKAITDANRASDLEAFKKNMCRTKVATKFGTNISINAELKIL